MIVGTENISEKQRELIRQCTSHNVSYDTLWKCFEFLVNKKEIQNEEEDVHPDWGRIFFENKAGLKNLPSLMFKRYSEFIERCSFRK